MESAAPRPARPGAELLIGAVDCHVHACPHLNGRSLDVLQAVEEAAAAGMRGIGLMGNEAVFTSRPEELGRWDEF